MISPKNTQYLHKDDDFQLIATNTNLCKVITNVKPLVRVLRLQKKNRNERFSSQKTVKHIFETPKFPNIVCDSGSDFPAWSHPRFRCFSMYLNFRFKFRFYASTYERLQAGFWWWTFFNIFILLRFARGFADPSNQLQNYSPKYETLWKRWRWFCPIKNICLYEMIQLRMHDQKLLSFLLFFDIISFVGPKWF